MIENKLKVADWILKHESSLVNIVLNAYIYGGLENAIDIFERNIYAIEDLTIRNLIEKYREKIPYFTAKIISNSSSAIRKEKIKLGESKTISEVRKEIKPIRKVRTEKIVYGIKNNRYIKAKITVDLKIGQIHLRDKQGQFIGFTKSFAQKIKNRQKV